MTTPLNDEIIYKGTGKFEYVKDKNISDLLINAFDAITLTENWDFMKQDIVSFQMSTNPKINEITIMMNSLPNGGLHSGASFGSIMREMQLLAKYGEAEHKKIYS